MAQVGKKSLLNRVEDQAVASLLREIMSLVDGKLILGDNVRAKVIEDFRFDVANFDYPMVHNLGIETRRFCILRKNNFADFKSGEQLPDENRLYVQCDTANTVADVLIWG